MSILMNKNISSSVYLIPALSASLVLAQGRPIKEGHERSRQTDKALNIVIKLDVEPLEHYLNPKQGERYYVKDYSYNNYLYLIIFNNDYSKAIAYVFDSDCLSSPSVECIVNHGFCVKKNNVWDLYRNSEANPQFESNGGIGTLEEIKMVVNHVKARKVSKIIKYEHGAFDLL